MPTVVVEVMRVTLAGTVKDGGPPHDGRTGRQGTVERRPKARGPRDASM